MYSSVYMQIHLSLKQDQFSDEHYFAVNFNEEIELFRIELPDHPLNCQDYATYIKWRKGGGAIII